MLPLSSGFASSSSIRRSLRPRWTIELDYRQLKGELGLDHYEGRSYLGFHCQTALVTCAHAFLTLERLDPKAPLRRFERRADLLRQQAVSSGASTSQPSSRDQTRCCLAPARRAATGWRVEVSR